MYKLRAFVVLISAIATLTAVAREGGRELVVNLKFAPQEGVQSTTPDLIPAVLERAIALRVEEGRGEGASVIGEGTDGDDETFAIRASSDVARYLNETLRQTATAWRIRVAEDADRLLLLRVMRFHVAESNKALGSVYTAEVKFAYRLANADGTTLVEGTTSGTATRYGRARSADNCNEVLSDSLKEAFATVLSDPRLQQAWVSGRAPANNAGNKSAESVEERLEKLDQLLKKGLITKEEYDTKRAEILKGL